MQHEDVEIEALARRVDDLTEQLFDLTQEVAAARAEADAWKEQLAIAERFVAVARDALRAARELKRMREAKGDGAMWQAVVLAREFEGVFAGALAALDEGAVDYVNVNDVVRFLFDDSDAKRAVADVGARAKIVAALREKFVASAGDTVSASSKRQQR